MLRRLALAFGILLVGLGGFAWWGVRIHRVPEPELPGTLRHEALSWEGRDRTFAYYRPAHLSASAPIVFVLHGSMGDGEQARAMTAYEFDRLAEEHGFLPVYPDGFERHWNGCRAKGPYSANELNVDDVGFLRAVAKRLGETEGADPTRVFATGLSNGGHMALRLALEAPDFVRAAAPMAAALPSGDNLGCAPRDQPVSVLLLNGTEDPMNPYDGGTVALYGVWGDRGTVHSTHDTARYLARVAGYDGEPEVERLPDRREDDGSEIVRYRWAAPGKAEVELLEVVGGGHTIPHPEQTFPRFLGRTNADVNAPVEIWEFFARTGSASARTPAGGPKAQSAVGGP